MPCFWQEDYKTSSREAILDATSSWNPLLSKPKSHEEPLKGTNAKGRKTSSLSKLEFKLSKKSVKFEAFYGKRDTEKALAFLKQCDVAVGGENVSEISNNRMVCMHLNDASNNWSLMMVMKGKEMKALAEFNILFSKKFLPYISEISIQKEWDAL